MKCAHCDHDATTTGGAFNTPLCASHAPVIMSCTVSEYVHRGRRIGKRLGTAEVIYGCTFYGAIDEDTGIPLGEDYAVCGLCDALVDVGGELRDHANQHVAERWEAMKDR